MAVKIGKLSIIEEVASALFLQFRRFILDGFSVAKALSAGCTCHF